MLRKSNIIVKFSKNVLSFTLIEIMIVVVVISILASLAIPVLKKARLNAHASQYLSERNVIASAINQYRLVTGLEPNAANEFIDPVLHDYLPPKFRKTETGACKGPFGGYWYTWHSGMTLFGKPDNGTTMHIGLKGVTLATPQEIYKILSDMKKIDENTFEMWGTHIIHTL